MFFFIVCWFTISCLSMCSLGFFSLILYLLASLNYSYSSGPTCNATIKYENYYSFVLLMSLLFICGSELGLWYNLTMEERTVQEKFKKFSDILSLGFYFLDIQISLGSFNFKNIFHSSEFLQSQSQQNLRWCPESSFHLFPLHIF